MALACALAVLVMPLAGCGGAKGGPDGGRPPAGGTRTGGDPTAGAGHKDRPSTGPTRRIPSVGERLHKRIPAATRQVVAVYGEGRDSPRATVVLYHRRDRLWTRVRSWPAHNGKRGWTPDHREDDNRTPVGVFTLSDAGGVLPDPGSKLPYTRSGLFAAPRHWPRTHWHDFDHVIAIDYNRVRGTSPLDPTRPEGDHKGGGIWLHLDHDSGTSGCVSLSKSGMRHLLRTLDPALHPVIVMGDRERLVA